MFGDVIKHICRYYLRFIIDVSDRQQALAHLTFASPLAIDQELLQCVLVSKVHMRSNKNSPPD
jgi:hypothetical protein